MSTRYSGHWSALSRAACWRRARARLRRGASGNGCPACRQRSETTPTTSSTCLTGRSARWPPRWPGWPPRFRPLAGAFHRGGAWGGSVEGGHGEFAAFWPSSASSSWPRARGATSSARAAAEVAAQISDGRSWSASLIDRGIPPRRSSRNLLPQRAPERYRHSFLWRQVTPNSNGYRSRAPPGRQPSRIRLSI